MAGDRPLTFEPRPEAAPGGSDRAPAAEEAGPPPPRRWQAVRRRFGPPLIVLLVLILAWEVAHRFSRSIDSLNPGPVDVLLSFRFLWQSGQLFPAIQATLIRLGIAYSLALSIGGFIAALMVLWPALARGLQPLFLGLQSLPGLAWVPLALIWFGISETSLIFVTLIGSVFAVTMGFVDAFSTIPPLYERAARNMGVKGVGLLLRVTIPAATPHLITTAKVGWSFAWRSLVGAEIIFATVGVGFLLNQGRDFFDLGQVIATMVIVLVLGIIFERVLFANLEKSIRRRWGLAQRR